MIKVAMDINKQKIKNIILVVIDFIKKLFLLNNLTKRELQGLSSLLTRLRFLPYTIIKVPFSLGGNPRGVSFNKNHLLDLSGKVCADIVKNTDLGIITNYYIKELNIQKNSSAADVVGLSNANLKKFPAWALVMPWDKETIIDKFNFYPTVFYVNRHFNGLEFKNSSRESIINKMYSIEHAENKINQMQELYKSIKINGYIEDNNLPRINILIKGNKWRWFMGDGGNHRSNVLACLEYKFISARVSNIIDIKNIKNWKNVKNGTYSLEEAREVFDSFFSGDKVRGGMV